MTRLVNHSLDGESRVTEISAILSIFATLTTVVVALRTYARQHLLCAFGADDAFMVAAQVLTIGAAIAIGLGV
jgi:hypothetical protein